MLKQPHQGRRCFVVVAAGLLLAACSSEGSPAVDAGAAASSTTAVPGGGDESSTATVGGGASSGSATVTVPPGGGDGGEPDAAVPGGFPDLDAAVPVGRFAPAYLRADRSDRVVIEVQAERGLAPRAETLQHVRDVLASVTGKPVTVVEGGSPPTTASWSGAGLRAAADAGANVDQGGGVAVLRLLFVSGNLGGDDNVLGVAVRGDVAAVFVDQTDAAGASLLGDAGVVEASVATHEVGHLLGLVDLYLATGRGDPDHPGHSTDPDSVMYWAVESGDALGLVFGPHPPMDFDDADRADLASIAAGA